LEHSWGRNVRELVGTGTRATLAARFVGIPPLILTNERIIPGQVTCYFHSTVNPHGPWSQIFLGIVGFHPRFPYGFPVLPDVHL